MTTFDDVIDLFADVRVACPTFCKGLSDNEIERAMSLWHECFRDIDFKVLRTAVIKHVMTVKWPPTIAEIREAVAEIMSPQLDKSAEEAWSDVIQAVRRYGSYNEDKAMASFDELTRKSVQAIGGFREVCISEEIGVERAHFYRTYKAYADRARTQAQVPAQLSGLIEQLASHMQIQAPGNSQDKKDHWTHIKEQYAAAEPGDDAERSDTYIRTIRDMFDKNKNAASSKRAAT